MSSEATLSLLLLAALLCMQVQPPEIDVIELHVLQKENDLLRTWLLQGGFREEEMQQDFIALFPNNSGVIILDGKEIIVGRKKEAGIATSLVFFDSEMRMHSVQLIVFN